MHALISMAASGLAPVGLRTRLGLESSEEHPRGTGRWMSVVAYESPKAVGFSGNLEEPWIVGGNRANKRFLVSWHILSVGNIRMSKTTSVVREEQEAQEG